MAITFLHHRPYAPFTTAHRGLMIRRSFALILVAAALLSTTACAPKIAQRGQLVDPEQLAKVETGISTREDVAKLLGSPTQVATFDEKTWYYFGRTTKQTSFFDPEVTDQRAVEIHFDDAGVVTEVKTLDPSQTTEISPVARHTPTYGRETTFFEQLVGNIGQRLGKQKGEERKEND